MRGTWSEGDGARACVDPILNRDVTAALAAPLDWRVRVVEQIDVDSPSQTYRRRSLQRQPLRPEVAQDAAIPSSPAGDTATHALLALPVAPVPKGPLLDFGVYGPDGKPALLLPRAEIAARQVLLLARQAEKAGLVLTPGAAAVVELAFAFTDAPWRQYRPDLYAYQLAGTGPDAEAHLQEWQELAVAAGSTLAPYADVPSTDSAVEYPALVVPALLVEELVNGPVGATEALQDYLAPCTAAVEAASDDTTRAGLRDDVVAASDGHCPAASRWLWRQRSLPGLGGLHAWLRRPCDCHGVVRGVVVGRRQEAHR